jgi:hypothetical protein
VVEIGHARAAERAPSEVGDCQKASETPSSQAIFSRVRRVKTRIGPVPGVHPSNTDALVRHSQNPIEAGQAQLRRQGFRVPSRISVRSSL